MEHLFAFMIDFLDTYFGLLVVFMLVDLRFPKAGMMIG